MPSNCSLSFHADPLQWSKSVLAIPLFPNTPVVSYLPQGKSQRPYAAYNEPLKPGPVLPVWPPLPPLSSCSLRSSHTGLLQRPGYDPTWEPSHLLPLCLELSPFNLVHTFKCNLRVATVVPLFKAINLPSPFPYLPALWHLTYSSYGLLT